MIPVPDLTGELERQVTKPKSHRKPNRARFAPIVVRELELRAAHTAQDWLMAMERPLLQVEIEASLARYTHLLRLAADLRAEFGIPL